MSRARHRKGGDRVSAIPTHHALIIAVGLPHPSMSGEGDKAKPRADRKARGGSTGGNWIAGAIKHPGALHKQLGVPTDEKIPAKKLAKATHSSNPTLRRRANLAKTLGKMHG